ncbi:MAG TPA: adenosylcobinamide-phosphate synthase CbiB [Xanthobacteraceae bacterium]|nr:adenosylcobinamide-phosphate synthase CbiB [Xanthobacteraceae bacterium]
MPVASAVFITFLAMPIELAAGYPQALVRAIGHPVTWIGTLIALLDRSLNRATDTPEHRRGAGIVAAVIVCLIVGVVAFVGQRELVRLPFGIFLAALAASALIAQRSLHRHVADVALALEKDGLDAGRRAVARIVGRDTGVLDEAGVARAAIESLAENFSDGVVAPVLWMIIGGLPGAALYKAINTADSMIGHRTPRHKAFGWAAARLDDLINLPASRLSAVLIVAAAALSGDATVAAAWQAVVRDAPKHRSPNAGYPEAAMAGALGLALAGPRLYGGVEVDDATLGQGRRDASAADIRRALALYRRADAILLALVAALAAVCFIARA